MTPPSTARLPQQRHLVVDVQQAVVEAPQHCRTFCPLFSFLWAATMGGGHAWYGA